MSLLVSTWMLHPVCTREQTPFDLLQVPDALLVEEVLAAQRADRAEIDDVAGELVLQRPAGKDVDLLVVAAAGHHAVRRCR